MDRCGGKDLVMQCAVMRHAERADACPGNSWLCTGDFMTWPLDPPLSEAGLNAAREAACELRWPEESKNEGLAMRGPNKAPGKLSSSCIVVTSPFLRCVQTAVECAIFDKDSVLLVDEALGEVYGPDFMGEIEPETTHRSFEEIRQYCEARGVEVYCPSDVEQPHWPEALQTARARIRRCFWGHVQRCAASQQSLLLVTHAEGVTAALAGLPAACGRFISEVRYCGFFSARAQLSLFRGGGETGGLNEQAALQHSWRLRTSNISFGGRTKSKFLKCEGISVNPGPGTELQEVNNLLHGLSGKASKVPSCDAKARLDGPSRENKMTTSSCTQSECADDTPPPSPGGLKVGSKSEPCLGPIFAPVQVNSQRPSKISLRNVACSSLLQRRKQVE
mmetsp:Transcript_32869/g.71736  ORF Transcript_32869/g.71736 Transcript_32869/m.71736 type:complete len:391 (-) Transcript_32869:112-1284(-)